MFTQTSSVYDLIYTARKDYPAEARVVADAVRGAFPQASTLLDVACGTGEHLRTLVEEHGFQATGIDLDEGALAMAQRKLPDAQFECRNMESFQFSRRFDAVTCLFSSIGYVGTKEALTSTLRRFRDHLNPGGVVVVEPWFEPGVLDAGRIFLDTAKSEDQIVARMGYTDVDGAMSQIRFEYLIGTRGHVEHVSETHDLALFTREETLDAFGAAGLTASFDEEGLTGRGLYVATASG